MAIQETGNADPKPTGDTRSLPPDQPRGGSESDNEITESLVEAFGVEPEPSEGGALDDFMADVRKESAERNPAPRPETADVDDGFVHEPTGKRFKTELELLKYDSGYNNNRLGQELKALREQNEKLREEVVTTKQSPSYTPTPDDIKRALWPSRNAKELSEDAAADFVLEAVNNASNLLTQNVQQLLSARDAEIQKLNARLEEMGARSEHRVDPSVERRFIEQYPSLAKLPASERVAMVAALAEKQTEAERPNTQKLAGKIPAPRASDHVETSATSNQPADDDFDDDAFAAKFDKLTDHRKELSILGDLVRRQRSFAGYEVDY